MIALGILVGLVSAAFQSFSYLYTRRYVIRPGYTSLSLLALAHAIMGLFALALLPFVFDAGQLSRVSLYAWPLAGTVAFYLAGQVCMFLAMARTDASRVSPLLGLKILALALITVLLFRAPLTPLQWLGVAMSVGAAAGLNYAGGGALPLSAIAAILGACVCYSSSDLCIVALVKVFAPGHELPGVLLAAVLSYLLAGAAGYALVEWGKAEDRTPAKWRAALPMGATWFAAMLLLYLSFSLLGAVFGNIVQAMRGPFSILVGTAVAARGHVALERPVGRWTLARRLAAALLMCGAIALFAYEKSKAETRQAAQPQEGVSTPSASPQR